MAEEEPSKETPLPMPEPEVKDEKKASAPPPSPPPPELSSKMEISFPPPRTVTSSSTPTVAAADVATKESGSKASATQTLTISIPVMQNSAGAFSQLLAGAMASPAGDSVGTPVVAVPVELVRVPVVTVPCFIAPAGLVDSPGFTGRFPMTHQAMLATVTAQAQVKLQSGHPSPSSNPFHQPISSPISPVPLKQIQPLKSEDSTVSPETPQLTPSEQKPQSAHTIVKTTSSDGYNWRKYGQKQVKSSENSRSYFRCTHASCFAKKKVEHCQDGRVTEIIYRGNHNHDPPKKAKYSKERGSQSTGPLGSNKNTDIPSAELNIVDIGTKKEFESCNDIPDQLHCSSDCEGDPDINTEDLGDEPDPKRRLCEIRMTYSGPVKTVKEPKVVVQTACNSGQVNDGYRWRKYGQKIVKGNPNPRSYYKCTNMGCPVRKHVERASEDNGAVIITYEGKHNHDLPPPKNGSEPAATTLLIAAAEAAMTSDALIQAASDRKAETACKPDKDGETTGERALELGGETVLESAETLLSIGCNSPSGENSRASNSDTIQRPLFDENRSAVPVENS